MSKRSINESGIGIEEFDLITPLYFLKVLDAFLCAAEVLTSPSIIVILLDSLEKTSFSLSPTFALKGNSKMIVGGLMSGIVSNNEK